MERRTQGGGGDGPAREGGQKSLSGAEEGRAAVPGKYPLVGVPGGCEGGGQLPEISGSVGLSSFQKFPSQTGSLGLAQTALFLY